MKRKIFVCLLAVLTACVVSLSACASGCNSCSGCAGGNESGQTTDTSGGQTGVGDGTKPGGGEGQTPVEPEPGHGGGTGGDEPPAVVEPVEGEVEIILAEGHLESVYVEWKPAEGAVWYNVYYQMVGESDWHLADAPLVRQYAEYFRADIVGLAEGSYVVKIVPVGADGQEAEGAASSTAALAVQPHDRSGYAFVNGTSSGAYNDDGTLKPSAVVLYITPAGKDDVALDVVTGSKGQKTRCVGLQDIINGFKKGKDPRPLCVRFIGNITDFAVMDKGDIVIDGCKNGVTFEGIGSDATANGWGLRIKGSSNVEIRNLGFMNCDSNEGDNIGLQQDNDHVWVHNCDLFYGDAGSDADQAKGDGALDTKRSDYVTHSYNHFWDSGKSNLLGKDPSAEAGNRITYHHNWYDHSDSRHPRIRAATVHIYNNYFDGNAKYGVGVTSGASAFVEANYFRSTSAMRPMMSSLQGTDAKGEGTFSGEEGGIIKSFGNVYDGDDVRLIKYGQNAESFDCYEASSRTERVPSSVVTLVGGNTYNNFDTAADFYAYSADSPEEAVQKVQKYAGRVGGGDFSWEFDDGEDGNYDVIPELKAALEGYTGSLVKVGGDFAQPGGDSAQPGGDSAQPGGGDDPGEGGQTGGEDTPGGGEQPVEGAIVAWFADDACTDPAISVSGNTSTSKGSVTYGGITYSSCLKMESSTLVSFDIASDMKLTLVLNDAAGKNIKIDGEKHAVGADGTLAITLAAGEHTITKGDTMNLFVLVLEPV